MRTVGLIFASGLWATLVFLFTLDLSFPDDALLERARWELNESTSGEWDFQASKAGLWRWSGLKVDDLTLYHGKKRNLRRKRSSDDGRQETPPTQVAHFDHLKVRADLPALLGGRQAAIFDFSAF